MLCGVRSNRSADYRGHSPHRFTSQSLMLTFTVCYSFVVSVEYDYVKFVDLTVSLTLQKANEVSIRPCYTRTNPS